MRFNLDWLKANGFGGVELAWVYPLNRFNPKDSIYTPQNSRYRYDYMSLLSDKVLGFYRDFDSALNGAGISSRGQVSGAPCDLISGYALLDIPEGESMLFEPEFCTIPASAALLSGKKRVSSETFTCLYGWPRQHIREEQIADLKLVADALFANGINHIVWHGKAHNPAGQDTVNFYATTHIGPSNSLAAEVLPFNQYLEKLSSYMSEGHTFSDIAVYLPTEDAWMAGVMPKGSSSSGPGAITKCGMSISPTNWPGTTPPGSTASFWKKRSLKTGS